VAGLRDALDVRIGDFDAAPCAQMRRVLYSDRHSSASVQLALPI
jgi:hypothetical protein